MDDTCRVNTEHLKTLYEKVSSFFKMSLLLFCGPRVGEGIYQIHYVTWLNSWSGGKDNWEYIIQNINDKTWGKTDTDWEL